jgi:hippurate hydrolase
MRRTVEGIAASFGATATLDWRLIFAPLINEPGHAAAMADAATDLVGAGAVRRAEPPAMVSEDFAFMLETVPGAYIHLGIGDGAALHHPAYAFDDAALPYGAAFFCRLVERASGA